MQPLVLAIDGGGSKTEAALLDAAGQTIGAARAGPCQLYRDPAAALAAIDAAFRAACTAAGLPPDPARTTLSAALAGAGAPAGRAHFAAGTRHFRATHLSTDAYAALIGAFDANPGILVISGTGSVACRWADGQFDRIGGWGFPAGDAGSGAWLGLRLVGQWLEYRDAMRPPDPVFAALDHRFGTDHGAILAALHGAGPADFAALVPLLLIQASPIADALLDQAAAELARLAHALLRPGLPLALGGSVAVALAPRLAALGPAHRADPLRGAFLIATGRAQAEFTECPACA